MRARKAAALDPIVRQDPFAIDSLAPAIYLQACRTWNVPPDPSVLAYNETYETQRADLKTVSGSA